MKILLFSDSHGRIEGVEKVIRNNEDADLIIHLGDYVRDAVKLQEIFPQKSFECVAGNNDFRTSLPMEKVLKIGNKKILITHGHMFGVKFDLIKLLKYAKEIEVDTIFFGHTHETQETTMDDILFVNPGSIGMPYNSSRQTYCQINCVNDELKIIFCSV